MFCSYSMIIHNSMNCVRSYGVRPLRAVEATSPRGLQQKVHHVAQLEMKTVRSVIRYYAGQRNVIMNIERFILQVSEPRCNVC